MVLLAAAVVGTVAAMIGSIVFGFTTAFVTRGAGQGRRGAVLIAGLFPFICLIWGGAIFACQALVNQELLHRDPGAGDTWQCPLPNGYAILMIDTTDYGLVYNPKTQFADSIGEQADAPNGVRLLQVDRQYVIGGLDSKVGDAGRSDIKRVDSYFLLNATTAKRLNFPDYESLKAAAAPLGIRLKLEPIVAVYSRYRFTWFDWLTDLLLFVPPIIAGAFIVRWILRLRKVRTSEI